MRYRSQGKRWKDGQGDSKWKLKRERRKKPPHWVPKELRKGWKWCGYRGGHYSTYDHHFWAFFVFPRHLFESCWFATFEEFWRYSIGCHFNYFFYYLRFLAQINGTFMETLLGCCCWRRHIFRLFHPSETFSHFTFFLITCSYFLFFFCGMGRWEVAALPLGARSAKNRRERRKQLKPKQNHTWKTRKTSFLAHFVFALFTRCGDSYFIFVSLFFVRLGYVNISW